MRQNLEPGRFLQDCRRRLETKLSSMEINIECKSEMQVSTDPELLFSILENLLLNAFEARGEGTIVQIRTGRDDDGRQAVVEIIDNGPEIAEELLPECKGHTLWCLWFFCNTMTGHVILLFEVQKNRPKLI